MEERKEERVRREREKQRGAREEVQHKMRTYASVPVGARDIVPVLLAKAPCPISCLGIGHAKVEDIGIVGFNSCEQPQHHSCN